MTGLQGTLRMTTADRDTMVQELYDREMIRVCMHRYTRAIDRRDFDLLKTCFWPDAIDEHGGYNGPVSEFWDWVYTRTLNWERTVHSLSQIMIDLRGEEAAAETYFTAYHKKPRPEGGWFDELVGGRYVDRMVKKQGEWRIQHRICVFEWFRHFPDSFEFDNSPWAVAVRGQRLPDDPIYRHFAGLL